MLIPSKIFVLAAVAAVALSACQKSPCDTSPPSDQIGAADLMLECIGSLDRTPVGQMPTSGSASYSGFLAGEITPSAGATDSLIGDASLSASFSPGSGTVSGTVNNISSGDQGALSGKLTLSNGTISANIFTADLDGTLSGYNGQTVNIATTGAGAFLGNGAEGILYATTGTAVLSGGYSGTAEFLIFAHE